MGQFQGAIKCFDEEAHKIYEKNIKKEILQLHQNLKKVYENASGKDMAVTDKEFNKAVLDPSNNSYKVLERYR